MVQTLKNSAAIRVEMHSILRPAWNTHQVIPLWLDIQRIGSDRVRAGVQPAPPRRPAITRLFSRVETHLADRATRERQGMTKPASIQQRIRRRLTR
ncbi:protein kinase [Bifidobacterium adolescentis]|nr:protein kinase [Bifidobacterium adolescentis]